MGCALPWLCAAMFVCCKVLQSVVRCAEMKRNHGINVPGIDVVVFKLRDRLEQGGSWRAMKGHNIQ